MSDLDRDAETLMPNTMRYLRERIAALTAENEALKHTLHLWDVECGGQSPREMKARVAALEADVRQLGQAILWADGQHEEFRPREPGEGAYWWRAELMQRAGLKPTPLEGPAPGAGGRG